MRSSLTCGQLAELAPEFALGALTGDERAAVLSHLVGCAACQVHVQDLSAVADRLLLLAPEDEPPAGFESRVLAGMVAGDAAPRSSRRIRSWRALAAAAVIAVVGAGGGLVGHIAGDARHSKLNGEYVQAMQRIGGRSLRAAALVDSRGTRVGQAFIYDGKQSWVFVSVDRAGPDGTYTVVCTGKGATPQSWPGLRIHDGRGSIGWTVQGDVRRLDTVNVVDTSGQAPFGARMDLTPV